MRPMTARRLLLQAAGVRTAYGVVSLAAPEALFAAARVRPDPDTRYANALFGGRDLTIAGMTVAAVNGGREREALLLNASCEATETAVLLIELKRRGGLAPVLAMGLALNALGWLSVVRAARLLDRA